ncbi:MAG: Holliday junction resolvase RuvX [Rikenellaceae bacterium]|nr:Holliday junction resolvase RuvX [Rikenellaceae bacterium]
MGRILAVDYGTRRTGLAVTDPLRIISSPLVTVPTHTLTEYVVKYSAENPVDIIVVGKPLQSDGSPSATFPHVQGWMRKIARLLPDIKVVWYDERYTSVMAKQTIIDSGAGKMQRRDKAMVDRVSAAIILQGYMESAQYRQDDNG